jgi:hypothetical protein
MKVDEAQLAMYISHYKQTASARKKAWEMKHIQNKVQRPSMRRCASSMGSETASSHQYHDDSASSCGGESSCLEMVEGRSSSSVGAGLGVSAINFDQHSSLIRFSLDVHG